MERIQTLTIERYESQFAGRHLLHDVISYWADRRPGDTAIINATRGTELTWAALDGSIRAAAGALHSLGFSKGDYLATSLPLLNEHIVLEYACFRLGVIHVPLDLRLSPAEVIRSLNLVRAGGFAFPGKTAAADFGALGEAVKANCPSVDHLVQFAPPDDCIPGAKSAFSLMAADSQAAPEVHIAPEEPAQVIFTTGSTGSPKAALLSHRGITCQNMALGGAFDFEGKRVLVNLPPSHVGCQAELLMSTLFYGATAVTLEIFDAGKSLEAIENYRVNLIGQIPAMFHMEWRHSEYDKRDLSSLTGAVYGGQSVPLQFLERMRTMAPELGTGLGLTETSGFCTYTPLSGDPQEIAASIGHAAPAYPMSIRGAMRSDGAAGEELARGEIGHVCFRGPQTFLGYVNDEDATRGAVSTDGWLYTGDLGFVDDLGLHFSGRAKFVIKPAGNQVFPGDIEAHFSKLDAVASVGVVGHEHSLWSEAIVAFIEKKAGVQISETDLRRHARQLTSYMRPLHYVVVEPGQLPLNRTAKVDLLRLQQLAAEEVKQLRARGRWDRVTEDGAGE